MPPKSPWRKLWHFLQRENLHRLLLLIVLLLLASSIGISWFEPEITITNGFWWSIVTLTTVGYGDISPVTIGGRFIAVVLMIVGIGLLGTLSASIASFLIEKHLKEDRGMGNLKLENHIILCEWHHRTKSILNEFRHDPQTAAAPIVLIANLEHKPLDDDHLHFIQGNVTDETLQRANIDQAKTVVILGDDNLESMARDAKVVLTALTIETLNPNVYTIAELTDEANVAHCQRANTDEIIVGSELSCNLIARAALNHGLSKVVTEILSSTHGHELYKVAVPASLVGQSFIAAFTELKQRHQSIILAVQQGAEGAVIANPPVEYQFSGEDYLIVVAEEKPEF